MMSQEELERSIGYLMGDISRLFKKVFDRRVQQLDLTRSQWLVVAYLLRSQGVTQSQLAARLEIERPTLGRLIDRLEAKGWVERRTDPKDRRANRLYISQSAVPSIIKMQALSGEVVGASLTGITPADVERLTELLLVIKDNLSAAVAEPELAAAMKALPPEAAEAREREALAEIAGEASRGAA